jgi:protein required for attachment to host cells
MLGDLRAALGPQSAKRLAGELNKDLTKVPVARLADHLRHLIRG